MAELVGIYAASHGPLIVRNWDVLPAAMKTTLTTAFTELGRRINAARPDVLIVFSPDHWVNFFLDNLPSICIGVGETHAGPPEPWLAAFPHKQMAGHAPLAQHLLARAFADGFEPSVSYKLALDHGFCIPLWKANLDPLPAIVPVILNTVEPPFPSPSRCFDFGKSIADAVKSFPDSLRVAVLATGGMSHSIGEATMGAIDEAFDRECLQHLASGDRDALMTFLDQHMPAAGNGTAEMRNWLAAHGAAGARGFDLIHYSAMPEIYVGCGVASWATT
jgi:aromatic ring-opening dioxygenase catalytic subunit (LigB family)